MTGNNRRGNNRKENNPTPGRNESYIRMLEASAKIQYNIAAILEAKAYEADKAKSWICSNLHPSRYKSPDELHKQTLDIHDTIVEVIDGITKMEQGLARNLKIVLGGGENDSEGYNDMFEDDGDQ
jgi:hypothetical protein